MWIQFFLLKLCHLKQGAVSTYGKKGVSLASYKGEVHTNIVLQRANRMCLVLIK